MPKFIAVVIVALLVIVTAGCAGSGIAAFDREQTEADVPAGNYEGLGIRPESTRFLAEDSTILYFAAHDDRDNICLIAYRSDDAEGGVSGCSDGMVGFSGMGLDGEVQLIEAPLGERDGWRKLAPNLYVKE